MCGHRIDAFGASVVRTKLLRCRDVLPGAKTCLVHSNEIRASRKCDALNGAEGGDGS